MKEFKKNAMKKLTFLLFCLIAGIGFISAQTVRVTGTVISSDDQEPVIGASVVVKGAPGVGGMTDVNGAFSFNAPTGATTIIVSYIGMKTKEVAISQNMRIYLDNDTQLLDEVVVVGYGNQTQRSLASSVVTVKSDGLKDIPSPSVDQMLQGRAAGVSITNPNAGVGQPPVVIIRGVSTINSGMQPLYVIDGIPMTSGDIAYLGNANALADINPTDIESMTILKDAAATAIYGSRAANGVVLITTKKGKHGATKISYDMNVGTSSATKNFDVMNAKEYVEFKTSAWLNANPTRIVDGAIVPQIRENSIFGIWDNDFKKIDLKWDNDGKITNLQDGRYVDTNWAKQLFQKGSVQNHTLSISNATETSDYYMSINRVQQGGIVLGDEYERTGIRANANVQPNKYLKIGMSSNFSYGHTRYVDASRNDGVFSVAGFPRVAVIMPPNFPARRPDGSAYFEQGNAIGLGPNGVNVTYFNPLSMVDEGNAINTWVSRIIASSYAEVTPITGLKFRTQGGIDFAQTEEKRQWSPKHGDGFGQSGLANAYLLKAMMWTWTNTVSYTTTLNGVHNIHVLAGMESLKDRYNRWTVQGTSVSDPAFMGIETNFANYTAGGTIREKTMISYLGNVNYDYKNKYILSGNFRRDGYSPLGVNSRWGSFWGAAGAWRLSEESFFDGIKGKVNDLKLKASYGVVGNTDIGYYPAKSYYSANYYAGGGSLIMTVIGDSNLKWESSSTFNFGLDATLFNRFFINADFYKKKSIDLILGVAQAPSTGIYNSELYTNSGQIGNTGFELTVSADIVKNREFTWNSTFNIAFNQNKVLKLEGDLPHADLAMGDINNISVEGKSLAQLYLFPTGGIDPETGRRIFYGSKGEKVYYRHAINTHVINPATGLPVAQTQSASWRLDDDTPFQGTLQRVICGNSLPTYYGGWTNSFHYKGFDLNIFFQFSGGNHIFNGMKSTSSDMRFWNNAKDVVKNHWSETNKQNATYAKPVYMDNTSNGSAYSISDFMEKGDYIRLKNMSLGYTFNTKGWLSNAGLSVSNLRLFIQAQNLFILTKYTGLDPETISNVGEPVLAGGVDKNTLPQARAYTFGLNVTF